MNNEQISSRPQGLICTFYSYKGGVGRSMALANIALLLARRGKRVLAVDWDLEAPGLNYYFASLEKQEPTQKGGLIAFLESIKENPQVSAGDFASQFRLPLEFH